MKQYTGPQGASLRDDPETLADAGEDPDTTPRILVVSPFEQDHTRLDLILGRSRWKVCGARTCGDALRFLREKLTPVVICEHDLPDGKWADVLNAAALLPDEPAIIAASRNADCGMWAEVLNLGGFDLLAKPFDEDEVWRSVLSGWRHWAGRATTFPRTRESLSERRDEFARRTAAEPWHSSRRN